MIEFKEEKLNLLNECESCFMLGKLATDEKYYPNIGEEQKSVTIYSKTKNSLLFYIKELSIRPNPIKELDKECEKFKISRLFTGMEENVNKSLLQAEGCLNITDINERAEKLYNLLKDKIVIFKPNVNYELINVSDSYRKVKFFKNLYLYNIYDSKQYNLDDIYIPVPILNVKSEVFEEKLVNNEPIDLLDYNITMEAPSYILCNNFLYYNFKDTWIKLDNSKSLWRYKNIRGIKRARIGMTELKNSTISVSDNLVFIPSKHSMLRNIDERCEEITIDSEISYDINRNFEIEKEFIDCIFYSSLNSQLFYDYEDIVNLHVSIKTNQLTILAGMTGVGKTQLACKYASILGCSIENENLIIVPISPSYTEPGDLLGYFNPSSGLYIASDTGLVDFIIRASKEENANKIFCVIFDEMNLSQIEYWFAPFLSILELKEENRTLQLYSKNACCQNNEKYPKTVLIRNNIRFIGTINVDETTKDFSDRLLDRANIITLKKKSFKKLKDELEKFELDRGKLNNLIDNVSKLPDDKNIFSYSFSEKRPLEAFTDSELNFFDSLHELLQKYDSQKGVSFRVLEQIGSYLNNIPMDKGEPILSREKAIDLQIKQRIITKIRGSIDQYEHLIGTINNDADEINDSKLYNLFTGTKAKMISSFTEVIKEIKRKAKEMFINDYAS